MIESKEELIKKHFRNEMGGSYGVGIQIPTEVA